MSHWHRITLLWLLLVALTLAGALLGLEAEPGAIAALLIVFTMALKGRLVIDYFMELRSANHTLRNLMRLYFYLVPLLVLLVYLYGAALVRWSGV